MSASCNLFSNVTVPGEAEGEMECELQSKDFFVQVGMLVVEGRTPQRSERGRIEGKHCGALKPTNHVCERKIKECQQANTWVQEIGNNWHSMKPVIIDVLVQLTEDIDAVLLLEQWTISVISSNNSHSTSGSQLLQAVRSHIHFSQLSAWLNLSRGAIPYNIKYRMNCYGMEFIQRPTHHEFPLASLPGQRYLQVTVKSLPRCTIQDVIDLLTSPSNNVALDTRSPLRKRTCLKEVESNGSSSNCTKPPGASTENECDSDLEKDFLPLDEIANNDVLKDHKQSFYSNSFNLGACSSNWESNGFGNGNKRKEKCETNNCLSEQFDVEYCDVSKDLKDMATPSKESYSEPRVDKRTSCASCSDKRKQSSNDLSKMVLQRKHRSLSEHRNCSCNGSSCKQFARPFNHIPSRHGTASNTSDVDIHAIKQPINRECFRRSVQLPIGACTEPVFNPKTGLPVSSSPAPLRRSTNELYEDTTDFSDGLSNKVDYRDLSKLLSRSAPASTTQSLLVNFEESVLNGRMEPVGTVEGFTAELSASGSFCPRHVKLPILSCFYRLSDDDAPSPYMGYISLKDQGRRGYHVPKRGTIQLTVFNPNKTVVKMFVVLFDFSDMPPKTQTFLRQKTYSALKGNVVKTEAQQTLHYLLHLR